MIHGRLTPARQAVIELKVSGPEGIAQEFETIIDTGFDDFLALPLELVAGIQLSFEGPIRAQLADGSIVPMECYRAVVEWDGRDREVMVVATDGKPLIGMAMLFGYELRIEVVDRGNVFIERRA